MYEIVWERDGRCVGTYCVHAANEADALSHAEAFFAEHPEHDFPGGRDRRHGARRYRWRRGRHHFLRNSRICQTPKGRGGSVGTWSRRCLRDHFGSGASIWATKRPPKRGAIPSRQKRREPTLAPVTPQAGEWRHLGEGRHPLVHQVPRRRRGGI